MVKRELVDLQENIVQCGVIRVHAGVNIGDDSHVRNLKGVLRILDVDDAGSGLVSVAVPDRGAKIIYWSAVGETRGRRGYGVESTDQAEYLIELRVHNARRAAQEIQEGSWVDQGGGSQKEDLIERAVNGGDDRAILQDAELREHGGTQRRADNEAVISSGGSGEK